MADIMFIFLPFLVFTRGSLASSTSKLEGWQFDDRSRSSWDLVWTCLSTIFACTWTVLCLNVPPRRHHNSRGGQFSRLAKKVLVWLISVLCPELVAWIAVEEYFRARQLAIYCNAIQAEVNSEVSRRPTLSQQTEGPQNSQVQMRPVPVKWTTRQGFCIEMGGLAVQTQDAWLFTISRKTIGAFVRAGLVKGSDFDDEDIKDQAKVDTLGKLFTVVQSAWLTCNIIARVAYSLPISPLELTTVAYVALGLLIAGFWWLKPKDMTTSIAIPLQCKRDDLPVEILQVMDASPKSCIQLRADAIAQNAAAGHATKSPPSTSSNRKKPYVLAYEPERLSKSAEDDLSHSAKALNVTFATLLVIIFGAVHVAGWNFIFPTIAERTAWRVFSLIGVGAGMAPGVLDQWPWVTVWLGKKKLLPSCMKSLGDPTQRRTQFEEFLPNFFVYIYMLTRLGIFALTLASLRALPENIYITPDWLSSIPHI